MAIKNIQYCIYCGTKNKLQNKKCIKCHKKLNPKDRPFINYLKSKIKDDLKGRLEDNIFSIITNYIKSNLYGFILTCSIIASTTCIVVNIIDNNHIQNVTEKPTFKIETIVYAGQGLSPLEVAQNYVNAVIDGNTKVVKSLQLENFYPEIIEEIENLAQVNPGAWLEPALEHDFIENREALLKNNISMPYVGESELVSPEGYYGEYHYIGYIIAIPYCSYNTCPVEDTVTYAEFYAREELQLIEIDGNYYVLGEKIAAFMSVEEAVKRRALLLAEGDTTNLSFDEVIKNFDNCNEDKECLEALGYTNLYSN